MGAIVDIQVERLMSRLRDRDIGLDISSAASQWLGRHGYDPIYGARPLKRVIQRNLENVLATMVLKGEVEPGETVTIDADADGLTLNGARLGAHAA